MKVIATMDGDSTCGAIVWWTLKGRTNHERLKEALAKEGSTANPPEPPSAMAALSFACGEVARAAGLESRNIARGEWALVRNPEVEGETLSYDLCATAKVAQSGAPELMAVAENAELITSDIRVAFEQARTDIPNAALSSWLCKKLERFGGVSLRDNGGVYFIPADRTDKWNEITRALKACGQEGLYNVPAMRSADAIDAILSALIAETEAAVNGLMAELADGELGPRALDTRIAKTDALTEKLERYETLLGKRLPDMAAKIAEARVAVVTAHSLAETAHDKAAE